MGAISWKWGDRLSVPRTKDVAVQFLRRPLCLGSGMGYGGCDGLRMLLLSI